MNSDILVRGLLNILVEHAPEWGPDDLPWRLRLRHTPVQWFATREEAERYAFRLAAEASQS